MARTGPCLANCTKGLRGSWGSSRGSRWQSSSCHSICRTLCRVRVLGEARSLCRRSRKMTRRLLVVGSNIVSRRSGTGSDAGLRTLPQCRANWGAGGAGDGGVPRQVQAERLGIELLEGAQVARIQRSLQTRVLFVVATPSVPRPRSRSRSRMPITVDCVSREHAWLRADSGKLTTEDLGRCSGTTLDGVRLLKGQPRTIRRRARIGLGDVEFDSHFLDEQG